MAISLLSLAPCALPPLSGPQFRSELGSVRDQLAALQDRCPPGHVSCLAELIAFVDDEIGTAHDGSFLVAADGGW